MSFYRWRKLAPSDQQALLTWRKQLQRPWHSPHHVESGAATYLITAACYEHFPHIGASSERISAFTEEWLSVVDAHSTSITAWVVLPNHYHALVTAGAVLPLLKALGRLHGRLSYRWNADDGARGRQVWCKAVETVIKNDAHFRASINYVNHNAVKHGYVKRWQDWPWSSAQDYIEKVNRSELERWWREYPIHHYGQGWDDPEM